MELHAFLLCMINLVVALSTILKERFDVALPVSWPSINGLKSYRLMTHSYHFLIFQIKIIVGAMGGELSLKLPFTSLHAPLSETDVQKGPEPAQLESPAHAQVEVHEPKSLKNVRAVELTRHLAKPDENEITHCGQEELS